MREYGFSLTCILPYKDRFCPYTGEYGLVKTRILAYFMQCKANELMALLMLFPGFNRLRINMFLKANVS